MAAIMPPKTTNAPRQPRPATSQTTGEVRGAVGAPAGGGAPGGIAPAGASHTSSGRPHEGQAAASAATSAPQCEQ
jgi:hypothetical protein